METTVVVGVRSPKKPTPSNKTTRGRQKRKRPIDDDTASNHGRSAARPRIHRGNSIPGSDPSLQLSGLARADTAYTLSSSIGSASAASTSRTQFAPVAVLPGPGHVPGPVLQTEPQAYYDYRLHTCTSNTNSGPGPTYCSACIFYNGNGTMSIESHRSADLPTTYSQPFHPTQVYDPAQSVPSFYDINATAYPQYPHLASQPQPFYTYTVSQDNSHAPPGIVAGSTVPSHYTHASQEQGLSHLQTHHHHLFLQQPHQVHNSHVLSLQGLQQQPGSAAIFQATQGTSVPYPAYTDGMGGGHDFPVVPHQAAINEYHQPIPPNNMGSSVSPSFPGFRSAGWQASTGHAVTHLRQYSGGECGHEHNMPDDSGEFDSSDTDCDICGNSPMASVEKVEQAPPSVVKQEPAPVSNSKARRNPLSPSHRKQTAETRKKKACVRCRMQKMRCQSDEADPPGDCLGCRNFSKTSKKTIHRMPCYRGKITDAVLFRRGGLGLTLRWEGTEMKDVGDRIGARDIYTISFTLGICVNDITVNVTKFQPRDGDVLARFWTIPGGDHGVRKRKDLGPFCLADIQKTAAYFKEYIEKNAIAVLKNERAGGSSGPRDIIERTYNAALRRYEDLSKKPAMTLTEEKERIFLGNVFVFWFAMRHTTGSSWLCGKEMLGMKPETRDETYPLFGRVSVPRMILAQFDSINAHLLHKYGKRVLSELENFMSRGQASSMWYTVYLCMFILLREASWMSEDRYRHARNNFGSTIRYSVPNFVEELQDGCNNLLQHWHYYNADGWPNAVISHERHRTNLGNLSADQHGLVREALDDPSVQRQLNVWRRYKAENGQVNQPTPREVEGRVYEGRQVYYDWDHPFYWISQLFEENWQPHPTYKREAQVPPFLEDYTEDN